MQSLLPKAATPDALRTTANPTQAAPPAAPAAPVALASGSANPHTAALYKDQYGDEGGDNRATAGLLGGGLAAGLAAPAIYGAATYDPAQAGAAAASQGSGGALGLAETIGGTAEASFSMARKIAPKALHAAVDAKAAYDKWGGKEKLYDYDTSAGAINETKRGKAPGTTVNGFQKEIAYDKAEKALHGSIETVTGAAKGTSKILDSAGVPVGTAIDAVGLNPLTSAGQIAAGTHKMVKSGIAGTRHQLSKNAARTGEKEAAERGDLLQYGMRQAKIGNSHARNEAGRQGVLGAMEATTGSLGMAQFADPTGATAAAHLAMSGVTKAGKKGNKLYNTARKGLEWEEVQKMRAAAEKGDPEAMKWMLANDPRTASGQMLMHAQQGTDDSKGFAQGHIAKTLRLGDDGKNELGTGKLKEFDKLYASRTGQNLESQLKTGEALAWGVIGKPVKAAHKMIHGEEKKQKSSYGPKDMPAQGGNGLSSGDAYFAREMARLTNALDKEKQLSANGADADEQATAFEGVDRGAKPFRAMPEVREYQKIKDFRVEKTHSELIEGAEQGSLKENAKGEFKQFKKGSLYNPDQFGTAAETVDKTDALRYAGAEGKMEKAKDKLAEHLPHVAHGKMPADVREGVMAREDKRRAGQITIGKNLPTTLPAQKS